MEIGYTGATRTKKMKTRGLDFMTRRQAEARGAARKLDEVGKSPEDTAVGSWKDAHPDPCFVAVNRWADWCLEDNLEDKKYV